MQESDQQMLDIARRGSRTNGGIAMSTLTEDEKPLKGKRKYVFVQAPGSEVKHMMYNEAWLVTACGLDVGMWWKCATRARTFKGHYCRRCESANV